MKTDRDLRGSEVVTAIGLIVGAVIAVGGWVANGYLARRAARRQVVVDFLLSAYRRLDAASNRPMTQAHELAIEQAVADICLLGTAEQVREAEKFAREFSDHRQAGSGPLLEALRSDLRAELDLPPLAARNTWLRITRYESWAEASATIRAHVSVEQAADPSRQALSPGPGRQASEARETVIESYAAVESALRQTLEKPGRPDIDAFGPELARLAYEDGRISEGTAHAIEGLTVMKTLAIDGGRNVSANDASEFAALADALRYTIQHEGRE
jgi:hypothetical protein